MKASVSFPPIADVHKVGQNRGMVSKPTGILSAKALPVSSITNSILLPVAAALHFNATFWVLVVTNFVLMHAIWILPVAFGHKSWSDVDWGWHLSRWPLPLAAFAAFGSGSYAIWGTQLDSVFPN